MSTPVRAVVFGNHDVGVRGLEVLLAGGVEVPLVVTHPDEPHESQAFASLADAAGARGIAVAIPAEANEHAFVERISRLRPDFIFSFYYRRLLGSELLRVASRGALNIHGSLLPRYRGRAPVNWTVVRGETSTGATLHYMTEKPDAGDIVDQQAVPILPDDTAYDVFRKVTVVAEIVLWRSLPGLISGSAARTPQDPAKATYFGRRRPEDGRIDWHADASAIHNLVRGVAPPYPGAFTQVQSRTLRILKTRCEPQRVRRHENATLYVEDGSCFIDCGGGGVVRVLEADLDGESLVPSQIASALGDPLRLELQPMIVEGAT